MYRYCSDLSWTTSDDDISSKKNTMQSNIADMADQVPKGLGFFHSFTTVLFLQAVHFTRL